MNEKKIRDKSNNNKTTVDCSGGGGDECRRCLYLN